MTVNHTWKECQWHHRCVCVHDDMAAVGWRKPFDSWCSLFPVQTQFPFLFLAARSFSIFFAGCVVEHCTSAAYSMLCHLHFHSTNTLHTHNPLRRQSGGVRFAGNKNARRATLPFLRGYCGHEKWYISVSGNSKHTFPLHDLFPRYFQICRHHHRSERVSIHMIERVSTWTPRCSDCLEH